MSKKNTLDDFWKYVDKSDTCWLWTASKTKDGYGMWRYDNKTQRAHRISMMLDGRDPNGMCVLHSCDNPACVNPSHLSLGTQQDNLADMVKKGRARYTGNKKIGLPKLRKLTIDDARAIRASSMPQRKLATKNGVSYGVINCIMTNKTYKEI